MGPEFEVLNLQYQVCQFSKDEVWDSAEALGSYMVVASSKAADNGALSSLYGPGS
eukprot:CAMPEP_0184007946 /NCGR_PEP_ID=MMETSP0954-20121128/1656_1 /TAXON_ID=627963 /ORGANISM="Aplanochytrium sp, Strain PBS07" /LENGTH=54 /DNA_ID=CAMNT_0026286913 /DNA_START=218 /DNA_END=378 /DNA_ORIENTATION=+